MVSSAIRVIMVRGTDSNIPTGPISHPQKINDKNTTNVDSPSPRPITRGSSILPITKLMVIKPAATTRASPNPLNNRA
ncbi:hypothetical protein D3C78_1919390 [compost metagenome]